MQGLLLFRYHCFLLLFIHNKERQGWSKWEVGDKREDGKECDICPVKKGYGMGLNAIGLIPNATLYSVLDKLPRMLPQTMVFFLLLPLVFVFSFSFLVCGGNRKSAGPSRSIGRRSLLPSRS